MDYDKGEERPKQTNKQKKSEKDVVISLKENVKPRRAVDDLPMVAPEADKETKTKNAIQDK